MAALPRRATSPWKAMLPKVGDFARPSRAPQPRTAPSLMKAIFAKDGHWLPPLPREGKFAKEGNFGTKGDFAEDSIFAKEGDFAKDCEFVKKGGKVAKRANLPRKKLT
jgi:hypothetical protein